MEQAILQYETPPCDTELQMLNKEITMTEGEWRIFISNAVGESWESIVTDTSDKSIAASWYSTGTNLPIDGTQDDAWKKQMLLKFDGRENEQNQDPKSWDYIHQRTFSTIFNQDTAVPPAKTISGDQQSASSSTSAYPVKPLTSSSLSSTTPNLSVKPLKSSSSTATGNQKLRDRMYKIQKSPIPIATTYPSGLIGQKSSTNTTNDNKAQIPRNDIMIYKLQQSLIYKLQQIIIMIKMIIIHKFQQSLITQQIIIHKINNNNNNNYNLMIIQFNIQLNMFYSKMYMEQHVIN